MDGKIPFELTPREIEVFTLLMQGCKNHHITAHLHVQQRTVETHLTHIYQKLEVTDRTSAIIKAASEGWFTNGMNKPGKSK